MTCKDGNIVNMPKQLTRQQIMKKYKWTSRNTFIYWLKRGKIKMVRPVQPALYEEVD